MNGAPPLAHATALRVPALEGCAPAGFTPMAIEARRAATAVEPPALSLGLPPADALILVVEDTEDIRDIWCRILTKAGFRVVEAEDGEDGVRKTRDCRPDLVVMDMTMPVLNGVEASRRLKADSVTAAVPIIAVSADRDAEADARAAGCDAFLLKPVRQFDLIGHIRRILAGGGERSPSAAVDEWWTRA